MRESSESPERFSRSDLIVLGAAAILGAAIFVLASAATYQTGFPLDDSWIHQTYARNLALHGQWAFKPGLSSAGSTAPLWSGLLAIGFWVGLAPLAWAFLLGTLILWGLGLVGEASTRRMIPAYRPQLPWVGLFMVFEWHLLWAAVSGMETLLHALIVTTVLVALAGNSKRYLGLGLLTGLSIWVRPDGLTLLGPVLLVIALEEPEMSSRLEAVKRYLMGFGTLFLLYLLFNLAIGGRPMPNTFYAKQAEYAVWQARPAAQKAGELAVQFLVGPAVILLPGAIVWIVRAARKREWGSLAGAAWAAGYLWLYISRLPPYQHGRYLMPAMPIFFLWGVWDLLKFSQSSSLGRYQWFAITLWRTSLVMVTLLFVVLGARSYADDVALIQSEMVATAKWADQNLPPKAIVAAHDIGALGYFDHHDLIDLAGLVSPEAIPFMRDEGRLRIFLDQKGADYLIAFPEFYPHLLQNRQVVFKTEGAFAPESGYENMAIYQWK